VFQNEWTLCVLINEQLISFQKYFDILFGLCQKRVRRRFLVSNVCAGNAVLYLRRPVTDYCDTAYCIYLASVAMFGIGLGLQLPVWWIVFQSWQSLIRQRSPKSHLHVHKNLPSSRTLNLFSPIHTFAPRFSAACCKTMHPSVTRLFFFNLTPFPPSPTRLSCSYKQDWNVLICSLT
jgi:hypothetical protein